MRGNVTAFKRWAPDHAVWAPWAKPVLFANMPEGPGAPLDIPRPDWMPRAEPAVAIVVDLPGAEGVREGLALARAGYRPVPLYNGVRGPGATLVAVEEVEDALRGGAELLARLKLPPDAPPAFLLDANRMRSSGKRPGLYDNRWCVFPQDMPSAAFLSRQGVRGVLVRANTLADDLRHVLHRYAEHGLALMHHDGNAQRDVTREVKPRRFKELFYRFTVLMGLRRNAAGGFGGIIPEPSQHGGGYHGFG